MSTHTDPDSALRELVGLVDPERDSGSIPTAHLLDRVFAATAASEGPDGAAVKGIPGEESRGEPAAGTVLPAPRSRQSFSRRHWQGGLLLAAAACTLALATPTVLPLIQPGGDDPASASRDIDETAGGDDAAEPAPDTGYTAADKAGDLDSNASGRADGGATSAGSEGAAQDKVEEKLVRSGSVLVGTEDQRAARDRFVSTVIGLGGRVTSESMVTRDAATGTTGITEDRAVSSADIAGVSYPYPWYPSGPGIWISVQVPADRYDEAMTAAKDAGEVVQLQQSAYDVGAQVSDVDARIKSLEASLGRLEALMDQAEDVSDVIALEKAISSRQAELDSLRAQQRDLANQTDMSAISLTLMDLDDAKASLEPEPPHTWWESFLAGLEDLWSWLGRALLIVSPLLLAGAVILWVRRRRRSSGGGGQPGGLPDDGGGLTT